MKKLSKNIIMYVTEDLEEKVAFILNCETNEIIKMDSVGVQYLEKLLNSEEDIEEYLEAFEGIDIFE